MRYIFTVLLCVVIAQAAMAETWPRLSATAADTSYAAPADTPRLFKLGNLPDGEMVITADGSHVLGELRQVEVLSDGDSKVSFRLNTTTNSWTIAVTLGDATSVKVSYWSNY